MNEEKIIEEAESAPACKIPGIIADAQEGNCSKWLLKRLNEIYQDKLEWGVR